MLADDGGNETQAVQVLTLTDLQREYAIARAHVIVGASMPSVEATSTDPDDVFQHLLTLGAGGGKGPVAFLIAAAIPACSAHSVLLFNGCRTARCGVRLG